MLKFYVSIAHFTHLLTLLGAAIGMWLTFEIFRGMTNGEPAEPVSMLFAIGLAVIPYCLAGAMQRFIELEIMADPGLRPPPSDVA